MKSKVTKGLLLLYLMSLTVACETKKADNAEAVVDIEQIKKEIQAKEDEFAAAYNAGEMREIGYFAEDATSFASNQAPKVGREAIIEYLKVDIESNTDKIAFTTREVFISNE
jgi:ketosteroid isomerase-like protein